MVKLYSLYHQSSEIQIRQEISSLETPILKIGRILFLMDFIY